MNASAVLDLLPPNVAALIDATDPAACWEANGWHTVDGYAYTRVAGVAVGIHRLVMEALGHQIAGLDVDHLCRNRGCVNPNHLEPVTHAENMARTRQTECRKAGHDWSDPRNVYVRRNGTRTCAECHRVNQNARYALRAAVS